MASDFDEEKEMYPQLKRWLKDNAGCNAAYHVNESSFKFTPADKGYIPDVIGRKHDDYGNPQFIGIEAKNFVRDSQKIINQSVSSLAFSHKAYLALPKKLFLSSSKEVQERIEGRVRREHIGLLLVLKSRVDEHIPAPPQRTIQRIYNEVGEFFSEQDKEPSFWEEEKVWSETQTRQFLGYLYAHAPRNFNKDEDPEPDLEIGPIESTVIAYEVYHEDIETTFTINKSTFQMELRLETDALCVMNTLLEKLNYWSLDPVYTVYSRKPVRWRRMGLAKPPTFKIRTKKPDFSISFHDEPGEVVTFNFGTLLKNYFLTEGGFDSVDSAEAEYGEVFFSISLAREDWQRFVAKDAYTAFTTLHELLEKGTSLLTEFIDDDSD